MGEFKLISNYEPQGDQPRAIEQLVAGFRSGLDYQTLLGVTGSGKTFTMANVIQQLQRPVLVLAHNKTLAAQLCSEFKAFFPENAVEYFVSYYDYYQPEAYIPSSDTYIEKDASINDEIDKMRHSATCSLFERRDVIIVSSVSCIYSLGSPEDYQNLVLSLRRGMHRSREEILHKLVDIQYERNNFDFVRGNFRVRGDVVEIYPVSYSEKAVRIELFGDEIERISEIDTVTGEILGERDHIAIYPASHFVTTKEKIAQAITSIEAELALRLAVLRRDNQLIEAQRLEQRTRYDMEMLLEMGYCPGIENYSRHLTGRSPGSTPSTLLDYFPDDFLMIIDESHQTIPQVRGMYAGDKSRKDTLVEFGFRLPSAYDNRPLFFAEFEEHLRRVMYVSATPAPYEREKSQQIVEQIIRPTGLVDPEISVRPVRGQIDDLLEEIRQRANRQERVLVTTLTKRMSEDLTEYLKAAGVKVNYLHSEIHTLERMPLIRDLRLGKFDVLVGINLLREGLDLPEVSLVAILDADKEGFLRSETALVQTIGRAARNLEGKVIMYADRITDSMQRAIGETERRRKLQVEYNRVHNITPQTIQNAVRDILVATRFTAAEEPAAYLPEGNLSRMPRREMKALLTNLHKEMKSAAKALEFERAAEFRDMIVELEDVLNGKLKLQGEVTSRR